MQDTDKVIRLVEIESGHTLARFESPDLCEAFGLTFSPDGSRLIVTTNDGPAIHVWDLRAIRRHLADRGLDWDAPPYPDADPAAASSPPLPSLQVDLGPRDIHSEQLTERAQVLVDRYTARLKEDPDDVEAYHYRGHALDRLLRHEEAVADLTRAIRLRPNDAHLLDVRARNRAILQQFDLAIEDLDAALALDPNVADFRAHLAWCCNNRAWQLAMKPASARDVARALPLARRADELAPGVGPYLRTLGFAEYRAGRYAEAVATLERGLAINRGEFAGYDLFLLAMAYRKGGHGAEARSCHDRAVRWVAEQKGLSELDTLQLADLRTEAESVLAVPADELPADVFAPSS